MFYMHVCVYVHATCCLVIYHIYDALIEVVLDLFVSLFPYCFVVPSLFIIYVFILLCLYSCFVYFFPSLFLDFFFIFSFFLSFFCLFLSFLSFFISLLCVSVLLCCCVSVFPCVCVYVCLGWLLVCLFLCCFVCHVPVCCFVIRLIRLSSTLRVDTDPCSHFWWCCVAVSSAGSTFCPVRCK